MRALDRFLQRARIEKVAPYVTRNARVLDIGCAEGALYDRLTDVAEYVGIDPEAPVDRTAPNARFVQSTFPTPAVPFGTGFDLITALAILEHIPGAQQDAFSAACASYLRPGGVIAITVPSPIVDGILAVLKRLRLLDGMHDEQHYGYSPSQTTELFCRHGLTLERHARFELGLNHLFIFRKPGGPAGLRDRK